LGALLPEVCSSLELKSSRYVTSSFGQCCLCFSPFLVFIIEGDLFLYFKDADEETKKAAQSGYLKKVLADTIGFSGIEIIRRYISLS
jgi:hypothetical protein